MTDPTHDKNVHTIYFGRQVRQVTYDQIRDDPEIRQAVDVLETAVKANQLRYYVPPCQAAVDFLNDEINDIKMVVAPNGVGKAQPVDSVVMTPGGPRRMGELEVGDYVLAGDGTPTRVVGVFEQGERDICRITFGSDGSSTLCDYDHLWPYLRHSRAFKHKENKKHKNGNYEKWEVLTTREIINLQGERSRPTNRGYIPLCKPAQFESKELPIPPYILGLLVGDGCLSANHSVTFSTNDEEMLAWLANWVKSCGGNVRHIDRCNYRINGVEKLKPELRYMGLLGKLCYDKKIPDKYMYSSAEDRLDLLRGLMDTDGSVDKTGVRVEFSNTSYELCRQVAWLVKSLGGTASISEPRRTKYTHKDELRIGAPSWRVVCQCVLNPFRLARKHDKWRMSSFRRVRPIYTIEPAGKAQCRCIMVDHPSHTYLTDDFIVTHNTCLALIDVILDCIPNDPEWEIFKVEGVKPRTWMGPKKVAICTYKMQLHKRHIWPEIQKWVPHDQLGQFKPSPDGESIGRGHKQPSWDRDPHIRLNCGTKIYFMAYEQDQDVFESFACDLFLWDEQGVEAKFDGADERVRRRSGRHVFSLTPHKVEGRPDTGHGSWIHKMVTGQNTKGHDIGVYSMSIEDALERYYPAKKKAEAYKKWIEIPTKNNDIKVLREGRSRYYGEWHTTGGLVLDELQPDIHFIDRFPIDSGYTLYRGVDHGTRNPTACLWAAVDRNGFIYVYREYYSVGKTISQNVRNIVELSGNRLEPLELPAMEDTGYELPRFEEVVGGEAFAKTVLDSRSFSTMDPQSGRPTGWVYRACGLLCQKASGKHDEFRIPLVKELLRVNPDLVHPLTGEKGSPRMFFFNDLVNFQREWQGYVWEEYRSGGEEKNAKEHGRQKDNHLITALYYLAQIPMRYLGNYSGGIDSLPTRRKDDSESDNRMRDEALSRVTGY